MTVSYLIKKGKELQVIAIHIVLALVSLFSIYFYVGWVYFVLAVNIGGIINRRTRSNTILFLTGYIFGLELIGRMLRASPFVPYQLGNYFMLAVFCYGIIKLASIRFGIAGKIILLLCLPGFYMIPFQDYLPLFINSFSGIVSLAIAAIFFANQVYSFEDLKGFLKITILPIITIAVYVFIRTPSYQDIDFALSANFDTSGGFGSNQVSTVLGVGACLLLLAFLKKDRIFHLSELISLAFIGLFLFRALLTFSRGGVIGALLAVTLSYLYLSWKVNRNLLISAVRIVGVGMGLYILFLFSDNITSGALTQRYQGETAGTLSGSRDRSLNIYTSNRSGLAEIEWRIFNEHILLGVGPGMGYQEREKYFGTSIASHTEVTRLLAEQGLPGLFIGLIFMLYPIWRIRNSSSAHEKYYLIGFFTIAVVTSFHAGMRTILTPLFWALCCAQFVLPKTDNVNQTQEFEEEASPQLADNF